MQSTKLLMVIVVGLAVMLGGCSKEVKHTAFLSDYSKLQKESGSSLRYVNEAAVDKYSTFIIDPVKVVYREDVKAKDKLTEQQETDLTNYMYRKLVEAVQGAGKKIGNEPGPGVARVRVALTDADSTNFINILPQASLLGVGIGGASMEAEVVDSVTGEQIGAVIDSDKGGRIPFTNLGTWTAAKKVMDDWAERFQKRLEEPAKSEKS
jgi:hypothetical protein